MTVSDGRTPGEGDMAPDVALVEDTPDGGAPRETRLGALRDKTVVLYFYPRDDTPGCTAEAKDFSCLADDFAKAGAHVVGISPDSVRSHAKFRAKHDLQVRLASDESKEIAEAFGVWVEKQMYGRKYMGVERATFLLGKDGRISRVWRSVSVPNHAEEVLEAVKAL